uniref:VasL domain-containing protein n=1 Tax=Xenorhabdus mauleonii TaxID=351675 RepID=UPI00237C001A
MASVPRWNSGLLFYKPLQQQLKAKTEQPEGTQLAWLYQSILDSGTTQLKRLAEASPLTTWEAGRDLTKAAKQHRPASLVQQQATRGSFTLSYLKTAIYDIQRSHGSDVPLEELLRQ